MTTKEQERKALAQIKRIVEGLGEDSYIGMAFDGCFEMAESNIENDFANNPKEAIHNLRVNLEAAQKSAKDNKEAYDRLYERLQDKLEIKDDIIRKDDERIADLLGQVKEASEVVGAKVRENAELEAKVAMQEQEIMKLKAKLYDLMVGA